MPLLLLLSVKKTNDNINNNDTDISTLIKTIPVLLEMWQKGVGLPVVSSASLLKETLEYTCIPCDDRERHVC